MKSPGTSIADMDLISTAMAMGMMTDILGEMHSEAWARDPKRLGFTFSRYKFVAKMLQGQSILEIGVR